MSSLKVSCIRGCFLVPFIAPVRILAASNDLIIVLLYIVSKKVTTNALLRETQFIKLQATRIEKGIYACVNTFCRLARHCFSLSGIL